MGTVLRRFPRKTVNSQTDSDAAYTFRACINKSAREFQKEKSVYFTCMLSTTILKLSSMQIGFLCLWKRFKEDRSDHAFYVQWKATYINNRCNIKLK